MKATYLRHAFRRSMIQILLSVLAIGLLAYVGYHVWRRVTAQVTTEVAVSVSVEETLEVNAYVVREEYPLYSYRTGNASLVALVADGDKVPLGGTVASVYESYNPDIIARLNEIEEKISLLNTSLSGSLSYKDASKLDRSIQNQIVSLQKALASQDYEAASSIRKAITLEMNKRELILGRVQNVESSIDQLTREAESLKAQLGVCLETVKAPISGFYYASADGYERVFTPEMVEEMTVNSFRKACATSPEENGNRLVTGKMVGSYEWYLCTELTKDQTEGLETGGSYEIEFGYNNDLRLKMLLKKMVESEDGSAVVAVFYSETMPQDFIFDRTQPVSIVKKTHTGFQIPAHAIRVVDGREGVYVLDGSVVRFRLISILAIVDDVYVADSEVSDDNPENLYLQRNDMIITSGKGLYDGRILS